MSAPLAGVRSSRVVGKAVAIALTVALRKGVGVTTALVFVGGCVLYVAALPFLHLADVFGAGAAARALTHVLRLPEVLRAHGWHGVWVRRVRMVPGGMAYLVQPPPGLTAEQQDRVKRDGPGRLGVFEVKLTTVPGTGALWVRLGHHDPLEDSRPWTCATTPDGVVVGRIGNGSDLILGPTAGHIAVQGATQVGKTYLCRMVVDYWQSCGYPVCGSDQSGDLLTEATPLTAGDADDPARTAGSRAWITQSWPPRKAGSWSPRAAPARAAAHFDRPVGSASWPRFRVVIIEAALRISRDYHRRVTDLVME